MVENTKPIVQDLLEELLNGLFGKLDTLLLFIKCIFPFTYRYNTKFI